MDFENVYKLNEADANPAAGANTNNAEAKGNVNQTVPLDKNKLQAFLNELNGIAKGDNANAKKAIKKMLAWFSTNKQVLNGDNTHYKKLCDFLKNPQATNNIDQNVQEIANAAKVDANAVQNILNAGFSITKSN